MASGPITSWQTEGENLEVVTDFLFLGSRITVGGDCSQEIRRHLLLGRKAMTNRDSVLKIRDNTLPIKILIDKAMIFPVVTCGCESWTVKKAEHQRTDAFELWCWSRLLRVPWTARRSNLSILRKINPEYSLEGLMLQLKLQYFGYLMWKADSWKSPWCSERLTAEREEGIRGWDSWMASLIQWTWTWANVGRWWGTGRSGVLQSMGSQRVGHEWATEQQQWLKNLSFLRNCQTVFHSDCASLYSYQQWRRVPLGPHPCHHLVLSMVWILAVLMCVWW